MDLNVSTPLVSVLLPAYNAGAHIDAAIASIRAQSFGDFELIVVDDGSADDTLARIQAHAAEDARIRVVSRENRGLIATLNEAIGLARGDLIARMDADDIAYPERLARQVAAFRETPGLCLCATGIDTLLRGRIVPRKPVSLLTGGAPEVLSIFYTIFLHPTLMIDRRVAGSELNYDATYPHAEDFDLIRRLTARFPVKYLPEALLAYRQHQGSVSAQHRSIMRQTHMRIVAENLAAGGFAGDLAALEDFAAAITPETARRTGALMASIRSQFRARGAGQIDSYEFGWSGLFYLIYMMFMDAGQAGLLRDFMVATDGWRLIRRREAVFLKLTHAWPELAVRGLKASHALHNWAARITSRPAGTATDPLQRVPA
ncbi:MAG: glycosyltransferase family 2 protein [Hyphomonas sp.]